MAINNSLFFYFLAIWTTETTSHRLTKGISLYNVDNSFVYGHFVGNRSEKNSAVLSTLLEPRLAIQYQWNELLAKIYYICDYHPILLE